MSRLIVVSNRLPITVEQTSEGLETRTSTGGLVSALLPVIERAGGCWIGSVDGNPDPEIHQLLDSTAASEGFQIAPVSLPAELREDFYVGFCNEILWPLFHDLQSRCNFEPRYWHRYVEANSLFSKAVLSRATQEDLVWVQDYHLMLQGKLLAQCLERRNLVYFHHIPFPPPDVFEKLPWRKEILEGLLSFGLVGFQSARDRHNFLACVRRFFPRPTFAKRGPTLNVMHGSAETTVGTFPIGIDFEDFSRTAALPSVVSKAQAIRHDLKGQRIVLGVDRLDYTKGILERIKAFGVLLERYPGLHEHITLIQITVPSRSGIPHYRDLKERIEQLVAETNSRFARANWVPIQYLNRHFSRAEVVAFYRAADMALITPIKDGMNLVCKEFCAARVDETGVLILSEFAGAANQLKSGALLVNPYDMEGIVSTLCHAFDMDPRDVSRRMRRMRRRVKAADVYSWCGNVLATTEMCIPLEHRQLDSTGGTPLQKFGATSHSLDLPDAAVHGIGTVEHLSWKDRTKI